MQWVTDEKRILFQSYAEKFEKEYLLEPAGQKHLAEYKREREAVTRSWNEIKKAKKEGENITNMVLEKLLPYSNTQHNRESGYNISVAPAITKDLKKWFENVGWQTHDNWDNVANAIYSVIYSLIEEGDWNNLATFENNQSVSRGLKSGFLTPAFHVLNPKLRVLNGKTIDTINFLLGRKAIDRDLTHYKEYLEAIDKALQELDIPLFQDPDVFDAFCHWMCDKRLGGYARLEKGAEEGEEEEGPPLFEEEEVAPQNHWEAIYYLVKIGNKLGYKTYVADPSRKAFGKQLGEIADLVEVPQILKSAPEIERIDVIWYKSQPPFFLFEVEDKGTMREALHRLYNAMAFDARFFIVSPLDNQSKFEKWVRTAPFKEYEERYNFRTFNEVFDFFKEVVKFRSMRDRFLKL